jgi:multicomponent Na+:H+ antiporter subunit A
MRRSLIFDATVRLAFDVAMVVSVYMLFAGHNQPGGGFVGGLVAGAAISLRYLNGGIRDVVGVSTLRPWTPLSAGLALAAASAVWPVLTGDAALDQQAYEWHVWALGQVKVTTAAVFDTGVYLIVVGLILMVFEGFAEDVVPGEPDGPFDSKERPA